MTATTATTQPTVPPTSAPRRATWALWGTAAGLAGFLTNMPFSQSMDEATRSSGDASRIVGELSQPLYHAAAISGFAAVACLLFFAAGLARWGRQQASDSLALRVAPAAVTASAAALIAAYGVKGMLSAYLPGGFNETGYRDGARYVYFLLDDLADGHVGLQRRGLGGDRHEFRDGAGLEREVDVQRAGRVELEVLANRFLEALELGRHRVLARPQVREGVVAAGVSGGNGRRLRREIRRGECDTRDDTAGRVFDCS